MRGGAGFWFDPFEWYVQRLFTSPNIAVFGEIGSGKSSLVKVLLRRMAAVFGTTRLFVILDPKGEYQATADVLGLQRVVLTPRGGGTSMNVLDGAHVSGEQRRAIAERFCEMVGVVRSRGQGTLLTEPERKVLRTAIADATSWRPASPTVRDVLALLKDRPERFMAACDMPPHQLESALETVVLTVEELVDGYLSGMFDGDTSIEIDEDRQGIIVDISAVFEDPKALAISVLAVQGWVTQLAGMHDRQQVNLWDECWAVIGDPIAARAFQANLKLSRHRGAANIMVFHSVLNVTTQAADGSEASNIASGFLDDTGIRFVFAQSGRALEAAVERMSLNGVERQVVGDLGRGSCLVRWGGRSTLLDVRFGPGDAAMTFTDAAMRGE